MIRVQYKNYINVHKQTEFYELMYAKYPELLVYTKSQIRNMLIEFNKHTIDVIISTRDGVSLPMCMGNMFVGTYGRKDKTKDKRMSMALGVDVNHTAHESDGYGAWLYYTTRQVQGKFKDGKYWGFKPDRRAVHDTISEHKKNWKKYIHVPNQYHISSVFRANSIKSFAKEKTKEIEKSYNEFDFD